MVTTLKINGRPSLCLLSREMVKVTDQEKEKAIIRLLRIAPYYTNERICYIFRFAPERMQRLRLRIDTANRGSELEAIEC